MTGDVGELIREARRALWFTDVAPVPVDLVRRLIAALEETQ